MISLSRQINSTLNRLSGKFEALHVNVLFTYLRMPYAPPVDDESTPRRLVLRPPICRSRGKCRLQPPAATLIRNHRSD